MNWRHKSLMRWRSAKLIMHAAISSDAIRTLEEIALNALPAFETYLFDGWLLRFSEGVMRRANSVQPLYASTLPLADKIADCERAYWGRGLPTVFKLTAQSAGELLPVLAAVGYREEAHSSIYTLDALPDAPPMPSGFSLVPHPAPKSWHSAHNALHAYDAHRAYVMQTLLDRTAPPAAYAQIERDGQIVAVGTGVAERGWVGIFNVITVEAYRGQGLGRQIVTGLLAWGQGHGAKRSYLQVMDDNAVASRLYTRLGFRFGYTYVYLQKQPPRASL